MDIEQGLILIEDLLATTELNYSFSDIQELVFRQCWLGKGYQEIADTSGYDQDYIKRTGANLWRSLSQALAKKVTKANFRAVLRQHQRQQGNISKSCDLPAKTLLAKSIIRQDWDDVSDEQSFFGRDSEIEQFREWIIDDRCHLISILGMGGIGKTAIASKVAKDLAGEFEYVFWRSLRNAPPFPEFMTSLNLFLSQEQQINLPYSLDGVIRYMMSYLAKSRCLLVLDNVESILQDQETGGKYRANYEAYGQLFRRIAEQSHQSCLLLTSREQPNGISFRESTTVRSLQISGLKVNAANKILESRGIVNARKLIEQYYGNPLALKIAATTIKSIFANNVDEFLEAGSLIFGDIWDLLEQQFERLAQSEQAIMFWLAINREEVSFKKLKEDVVPRISSRELLGSLESLQNRSLIEVSKAGFTQQSVIMEYITEKLISIFGNEINTGQIDLLQTHSIIKVETKDYLRETQVRLILEPIIAKLINNYKNQAQIQQQLKQIIEQIKRQPSIQGYVAGNIINLLKYLQIDLKGWDFSQLRISQADLRGMYLQDVNFAGADFDRSIFTERVGSIWAIDFSPAGKLLAIGDDQYIKILAMPECRHLKTLTSHNAPPVWWSLRFSPDGKILASGGDDRSIRLWDVTTGKCLQILRDHQGAVWSLVFSPDGQTLFSSSGDGTIKQWQISTGKAILSLVSDNPPLINALALSSQGLLAASSQGKGINLWKLSSNELIQIILIDDCQDQPIAFSPDGLILAVGFPNGSIKLWDIKHQTWINSFQGYGIPILDICFSPDGNTLAVSSVDYSIRLWKIDTDQYSRILHGHQSRVSSIAIAPDSLTIASSSEDGTVRVWEMKTGHCIRLISGYSDRVWEIAFSPDGATLASANESGVVRLWNIDSSTYQELEHSERVKSLAFSPDGQTLASVTYNYQIRLWNLVHNQLIANIPGHGGLSWSIAFSKDGKTILTSGGDGLVKLWEVNSGMLINSLIGHNSVTLGAIFLQRDSMVATASMDKTVKLWDRETGRCLQTLNHNSAIWSLVYDSKRDILVTGSEDGSIKLWETKTGKCLTTFSGHTQTIISLDLKSEDNLLVSGSHDHIAKLWDLETREYISEINTEQGFFTTVALCPDSDTLATGSHDETIKLWNIKTSKCLRTLTAPKVYAGMNIKEIKGLTNAQKNSLKTLGSID